MTSFLFISPEKFNLRLNLGTWLWEVRSIGDWSEIQDDERNEDKDLVRGAGVIFSKRGVLTESDQIW